MHSFRSLASLAWRESRSARRRLLLYMSSIAIGVAALVAIDSFAKNITRSVQEQSRTLMGGDVQLTSHRQFPAVVDSLLDSLSRTGTPNARVTTFPSMAVIPRTGGTRLTQVRGVSPSYPFYGTITTDPAGQYARLQTGRYALVDPSLLTVTDAHVGDTLTLGQGHFTIIGTLRDVPGTSALSAALGPRIYVPQRYLTETQLLTFGSTADYSALLRLPNSTNPNTFVAPLRHRLDVQQVRVRTVTQSEQSTARSIDTLRTFIGIVGLIALLLGGIGVASGVRAFVARKIDTVAVLRCLGATSGQVLAMYVAQAALMGLIGATGGAALGVAIQFALPHAVSSLLPVDVTVTLEPGAIVTGILVGGWVALIFSLEPLLTLRNISPLQTLRRETDAQVLASRWKDVPRIAVYVALVASVVAVALIRARTITQGLWISAATAGVIAVLAGSATLLSWLAKRSAQVRWPYVIRQGIANVYRPANQTRAVMLSLGFGSFLLATLFLVQHNLLHALGVNASASGANLVFFDVQTEQRAPLDSLLHARGYQVVQEAPVVPMRIAALNGRPVSTIMGDTTGDRHNRWALRREYRSTYRDSLTESEVLVAGQWFHRPDSTRASDTSAVSLERDIADELQVSLGDVITWDVQGVQIPTRVTSFRDVTWTRFEPNFFAVFPTGPLNDAPQQYVVLTNVPTSAAVAILQRDVVQQFPNVSSIDLSLITETIGKILSKVDTAIRFMAIFSLIMGIPVLISAVASTRRARIREGVLLKTLGASRRQVMRIFVTEYVVLGTLGSLTGIVLAVVAAWATTHYIFDLSYTPTIPPLIAIAVAMVAITVLIGVLAAQTIFRETPIAALRDQA
jgi:putative ABC transport system permease protein